MGNLVMNGTCVIGQLTESSAFASVEQNGRVWVKKYSSLCAALDEARNSGLVDKLFAIAAAHYLDGQHDHCVAPIPSTVDGATLVRMGFVQPRSESPS